MTGTCGSGCMLRIRVRAGVGSREQCVESDIDRFGDANSLTGYDYSDYC